jgi:hypothetical protein
MSGKQEEVAEVSASELKALRTAYSLLDKLTSGEDGIDIQRRLKKIDPALNFPVIDQGDKLVAPVKSELEETRAALKTLQEAYDADKLARQNEKAVGGLQAEIDRIAAARGFTGETKDKFVAFMTEKGTADPALAAPAFIETLPKPPTPLKSSGYLPQTMHLFGAGDATGSDESVAELHRDPLGWQDREITKIMNEDAA